MSIRPTTTFLRWALIADAIATGATGLAMFVLAGPLDDLLQVPAGILAPIGLALVPYAAAVAYLGTRESLPRRAVWAVIGCNVVWAVDSVIFAFSGWVEPSALGYAFILAQALIVVAFAELQYVGLKRVAVA
jgi:hypothetical protein